MFDKTSIHISSSVLKWAMIIELPLAGDPRVVGIAIEVGRRCDGRRKRRTSDAGTSFRGDFVLILQPSRNSAAFVPLYT